MLVSVSRTVRNRLAVARSQLRKICDLQVFVASFPRHLRQGTEPPGLTAVPSIPPARRGPPAGRRRRGHNPSSLFLLYFSPVQLADFAPVQFDDGLLGMPPVPRPNPPESV